ncbi:MAG: hypothetical protein IPN17_16590 [Deltaproteobacteria bacterium]|nr:hypothetical protein [Deltaproteobacteria bacterium]
MRRRLSASMLVVVTLVALCVQVFSLGYMHDEQPPSFGRYFTYHALFLFSMNVLVLAPNLLQLFGGWELVGVTSYLLIGFYFRKPSAARAAVKAFWVTKFADMGLLFGLFVLFAATGSFRWDAQLAPAVATAVTLLFFLAVVGKSAQFPLHVWLPDAMEGPTPVSALLHAATMVAAGVFLIVRANPLFEQSETTRNVMLLGLGAGTALFAACLALVQSDIKKVLAYSTCSQLGYMVAALGAGSMMGGFFHLTTHAFFKALLFLAAGSAIHAVHSNEIARMGGLARRMPLDRAGLHHRLPRARGHPRILGLLQQGPGARGGGAPARPRALDRPPRHGLPHGLLHGPRGGGGVLRRALRREGRARARARLVDARTAGGARGAVASGRRLHRALRAPSRRALHLPPRAGCARRRRWASRASRSRTGSTARSSRGPAVLDGLARVAVARGQPLLRVRLPARWRWPWAAALAWTDRYLVDGLINMIGYETLEGGRRARPLQTGLAPDYVLAAVLGVVGLAAWAVAQ